jgi:uncharacterized surface protein with fasciclin (FAS1) repeats
VQAGASKFLAFIQQDPALFALYTSGQVKTVFAPGDAFFTSKLARQLRRALSSGQESQALLAAAQNTAALGALNAPTGQVIRTFDNITTNLGGNPPTNQVVVSQPNAAKSTSANSGSSSSANTAQIASGLGNTVNVVKADQPFTSGLIQVTDGLFTVPQLLSNTAKITGQSTFNSLVSTAGLTNSLDNTPQSTFFIPSNAAFAAAGVADGSSSSKDAATSIVNNHVVTGTTGYVPDLQNGQVLTSQSGAQLNIAKDGNGQVSVNGVPVIQSNLILPNGVAHVLGGVIQNPVTGASVAAPPPPPPAPAPAPSPAPGVSTTQMVGAVGISATSTPAKVSATASAPVPVQTAAAGMLGVAWDLLAGGAVAAVLFAAR